MSSYILANLPACPTKLIIMQKFETESNYGENTNTIAIPIYTVLTVPCDTVLQKNNIIMYLCS